MNSVRLVVLVSFAFATRPALAERRTVTLVDAVAVAVANLPALRQVKADTDVIAAQADEARAPLLPQLNGTGKYSRATGNFAPQIGTTSATAPPSLPYNNTSYNYWNFGLTLSQTLFDVPTFSRWRAAVAAIGTQRAVAATARLDAVYNVRVAFFAARANFALLGVAKQTLANQNRHLDQTKGFVEVGTHPEIDLAQSKADVANAQVALITAENNYETAKAALNQAMGVETDTDYDLGEGDAPMIDLEDSRIDELMEVAKKNRPELLAFDERLRGEMLLLRANKWGYAPTLGAVGGLTAAGPVADNLAVNWNVQAQLTWALFSGLLTFSQVKEAEAQIVSYTAQRDTERIQVRLEVERGRLAVRAAKATVLASEDALVNSKTLERLAEGRYKAGVGSALELSDAELALTNASAQRVQADFNVGTTRAQLLRALGRK